MALSIATWQPLVIAHMLSVATIGSRGPPCVDSVRRRKEMPVEWKKPGTRRRLGGVVLAALLTLPLGTVPTNAATGTLSLETKDELLRVAQQYLTDRAERLVGGRIAGTELLSTAPMAAALAARLAADTTALNERRDLLRRVNGGHSRAVVTISDPVFDVAAGSVTVDLTERTDLYFARVLPDAPTHEKYKLDHRFVFEKVAGVWRMNDTIPALPVGGLAPDTHPGTSRIAQPVPPKGAGAGPFSATDRVVGDVSGTAPVKSDVGINAYNYTAMRNYATTYWSSYNSSYRTYDGVGGDCTNFISQIVYAGGWTHVGSYPADDRTLPSKWFYGSYTWSTSYSWPAAHNWYQFAMQQSGRTSYLDNVWKMVQTDILQIDWEANGSIDHSMFVTTRSGSGTYATELYMTYHSVDTLDKPLSSIIAANSSSSYYAHRT
jgi:hypothetical protein